MGDIDVLIIGAGPTGGMLALELATQNVSFRIIDTTAIRSDKSRALAIQSRSQELLNHHGIGQKLAERGFENLGIRIFCNKNLAFEVDLKDMEFKDTIYPHPLMISQADTEMLLDETLLEKYGKSAERSVTCERLEQDNDGVTAWLRKEDGTEEKVRCKYVVGCDGAHSTVRKASGLKSSGAAYPQDFILADMAIKWDQKPCLSVFLADGMMVAIPMKDGIFRLICSRPSHINNDSEPTLKDFQDVIAKVAPGQAELSEPLWMTRFRLHHRIAENYRAGRMFLAGDAAHIHSPAGGQGMNTGMQDAANLGWKLGQVIRGESDDSLLDTYNIERHKIGQNLLRGTDRMFEFATTTNRFFIWLRNILVPWILPWVMKDAKTRGERFRFVSQLGIRYRHSPIVGQASTWKGKIRGGDRAPDAKLLGVDAGTSLHELCRGRSHHLLLFSGMGNDAVEDLFLDDVNVVVHKIVNVAPKKTAKDEVFVDAGGDAHGVYGFVEEGFVLVRPDGYISFIGPRSAVEELKAWLKR
jgi:2-polyprenyl-6-methoxyphenol hydroxylase-like FAD-dependent oxidoreductase